jgi:hypothetical protein
LLQAAGGRQVAHDVTYTSDFATAQCTVFGCKENDVLRGDNQVTCSSE